jgi:hypothetical protein
MYNSMATLLRNFLYHMAHFAIAQQVYLHLSEI